MLPIGLVSSLVLREAERESACSECTGIRRTRDAAATLSRSPDCCPGLGSCAVQWAYWEFYLFSRRQEPGACCRSSMIQAFPGPKDVVGVRRWRVRCGLPTTRESAKTR